MPRLLDQPLPLRRWALILYWLLIFILTHLPEVERFKPEGWNLFKDFDKLLHCCFYFGWTVLWFWLLMCRGPVRGDQMKWLVLGGLGYALLDELTQPLVARNAELMDMVLDMIGVGLGLAFMSWLQRRLPLAPASSPSR